MVRSSIMLVFLGVALTACDTQGLYPLGAKRDTLVPCTGPTSTWLRSTADRTEILVLGSTNPTAVVPQTTPVCFAFGWVEHDSSTYLEAGSYYLPANGSGTAAHNDEYTFNYDDQTAIISRTGAYKRHLTSPIFGALTIAKPDMAHVDVSYRGETHRFTALPEIVETLDTTTQSGVEDLFRLYNLPLFTSQVRLIGFGSGRMTQYILSTPAHFNGLIANDFSVIVDSALSPHTTIVYYQFEELSGITIDGVQKTNVNTAGAGPMTGILSFVMLGYPLGGGVANPLIRGTVDYGNLTISKGVAAGGYYVVDPDGSTGAMASRNLSYTFATDIDLRGVLPVVSP